MIRTGWTVVLVALASIMARPGATIGQGQFSFPPLKNLASLGQMFFEGYHLPPATSGPSFPAWSPDGSRLAFSMAGSIWTIDADGGIATQVTAGPTYDSQPQWSPNGRSILYSADLGGRMELFVVDVASRATKPLTRFGAVTVDPRWSPDGHTVAFVSSTRYDTYNIWIMPAGGGEARPLTTDFFHNIEPAFAPDGQRILFISKKQSVRGSGFLWEVPVQGGEPRLVHAEDTLYQARPVFSPDGSRIAYVSFRRGRNAIAVLPASGGEPVPITFDTAEAFMPAWSPDGSRIAYVDNSDRGLLALWVTGANGGVPKRVAIRERRHAVPVGTVDVTIANPEGDAAARVYVRGADGKSYFPSSGFRRIAPATRDHYAHADGRFVVTLPAGEATIEVTKGFEYQPARATVQVRAGETVAVTLTLKRMANLPAAGWYGGDNHVHMNYGGLIGMTPEHLALMERAEDLHVITDLICNRDNRLFDLDYFEGKLNAHSTPGRLLYFSQEYRPSFYGHMGLLRLRQLVWPFYNGAAGTAWQSHFPVNADALDMAHRNGGVGGAWHLFNYAGDPSENDYAGARELPVDVALGKTDFVELSSLWSVESTNAKVYYRLLNAGFRLPITAGTDSFPNFHRNPAIGAIRVYANAGPTLTYEGWIDAILAGKSFVTSGPLLQFAVDGKGPGDTIQLSSNQSKVEVHGRADSIVPMRSVSIIRNGEVAARVDLGPAEESHIEFRRTIEVPESGWLALRVEGDGRPHHILMESAVFAHTAPVYVLRGGVPIRSVESAEYFLRWIDRSIELLQQERGWNSEAEQQHAIDVFRRGRKVYEDMLGRSDGGRP